MSRKAHGRSWRSGYGPQRRCSRATKALRDRIDREGLFQRVSRLRARYREEGRHPRRGAPKCGARVALRRRESVLRSRWSRAGRRAITVCITHRIDRSGRGRGDTFFGLNAPPPRRLPHRANGERTRSKEARPWEIAGRRTPSTMHERASPSPRENGDRAVEGPRSCPIEPSAHAQLDGTSARFE